MTLRKFVMKWAKHIPVMMRDEFVQDAHKLIQAFLDKDGELVS